MWTGPSSGPPAQAILSKKAVSKPHCYPATVARQLHALAALRSNLVNRHPVVYITARCEVDRSAWCVNHEMVLSPGDPLLRSAWTASTNAICVDHKQHSGERIAWHETPVQHGHRAATSRHTNRNLANVRIKFAKKVFYRVRFRVLPRS